MHRYPNVRKNVCESTKIKFDMRCTKKSMNSYSRMMLVSTLDIRHASNDIRTRTDNLWLRTDSIPCLCNLLFSGASQCCKSTNGASIANDHKPMDSFRQCRIV